MGNFIDRTGETIFMRNRMNATIVNYRGTNDIDVQFENGDITYNQSYTNFKKGLIRCYNISGYHFKKITIINECNAIYDETLLIEAMSWYWDTKSKNKNGFHNNKKVYINGQYPSITISNEIISLHRFLIMYKLKNIQLKDIVIHHKDENKLNASIDNLEVMTNQEHASHHLKNNFKRAINIDDIILLLNQGLSWKNISKTLNAPYSTVRYRYYSFLSNTDNLDSTS